MTTTIRDRACDFASTHAVDMGNLEAGARLLQEFAENEVRLALQPREPSPELAEAEHQLRNLYYLTPQQERVIADELARLRTELTRKDGVVSRAIDALQEVDLCMACAVEWPKVLALFHAGKSFTRPAPERAERGEPKP